MRFLPDTSLPDPSASPEGKAGLPEAPGDQPGEHADAKPVKMHRTVFDESMAFYVGVILFAAIVLRVLLFVLGPMGDAQRAMYPDSYRYVELGETLVSQGVYGLSSEEVGVVHGPLYELREELAQHEPKTKGGLRPEIMRTPGYPALLGLFAWMGLGLKGVLLFQCLLSVISVLLVYAIGRALIKRPGPALFAAVVVAAHPAAVAEPNAVLTETCFTVLVLLGLWSIADKSKRSIGSTTFGGLMVGLSVLVRPVSVFLGPALALWMVVTDRRLKTVFLALLMVAMSAAPGVAWMARNHNVGFGYRLSSIPYINSYFYTDAYMRITAEGGDWRADWPATVDTLMGELKLAQAEHPKADLYDTMAGLGVRAIKDDPGLYAKVMRESMTKFFTDHSLGGLYQELGLTYTPTGLREKLLGGGLTFSNIVDSLKNPGSLLAAAWVGLNAVLAVGMVLGGAMLLWRRHWSAFLLLAGVMFYFVFATQATGLERFRMPVLGVEALLVASLFAPRKAREKKAKPRKRRWYERGEDDEDDEATASDDAHDSERPDKDTPEGQLDDLDEEPEALARPL